MSDDFEYSPEALDSRKYLLDVDAVIYVEGVDDELFWPKVFRKFSNKTFFFENVGGKRELLKKFEILKENNSHFIIATDLDYSFSIEEFNHSNVIKTYGHSIENTLIQKSSIIEILENSNNKGNSHALSEYRVFNENIKLIIEGLLHLDIFCCETDVKSIIGKNITKFTETSKTYRVCEGKIKRFKSTINIPNEANYKQELMLKLSEIKLTSLDLINGHFLFSGLLKLIVSNSEGFRDSYSLTSDSLLTTLLILFKSIFNNTHPHYEYYETEVLRIDSLSRSLI